MRGRESLMKNTYSLKFYFPPGQLCAVLVEISGID